MFSKLHVTLGRLLLVAGIVALVAPLVGASTSQKTTGPTTDIGWATYDLEQCLHASPLYICPRGSSRHSRSPSETGERRGFP